MSGGKINGCFNCGAVTFSSGAIVGFDLTNSGTAGNTSAFVTALSGAMSAGAVYTLTVKSNMQTSGVYKLASGASGFNESVTVYNDAGTRLGTLTVGQSTNLGCVQYKLTRSGSTLSVAVGGAKGDVDGNGVSDVMFVWTGEHGEGNHQHGYWMNGTNEWRSVNVSHPAEWENLGAYDMNSDGKADSVLVGNVVVNGVKGAYIGYYADGNDADSNWINIGYLDNSGNYTWKNKVGNLTGNSGKNSIIWHNVELGALGAWTDGTDKWVSLGGGYDSHWTLVGCGDFNGYGYDRVLMSYDNGAKYYSVSSTGELVDEIATSDSGWTVRAIGDFSGDGKDDIVAFHKATGIVAKWADGRSSNWSQLGQLDAKDWFVVGAGDYNGDGTDDLLVRQYSTGMLGYYSSGDMSQWNVLGYGVDMDWTVIA